MDILFGINMAILLCLTVGFTLGALLFFRPNKPFFASIIVTGLGCAMLGRFFQCLLLLTGGSLIGGFQIGILSEAGLFGFFFAANFLQKESFGKKHSPLRDSIAYLSPLFIALIYVTVVLSPVALSVKISFGLTAFVIAATCYSHLRFLIIPNNENGAVKRMRPYNLIALLTGVAFMSEMTALTWNKDYILLISGITICVISLAIVPALYLGVRNK